MDDLPNDILDIICKDLIKKEEDIFRKLSWKYRKIYLKNIKYLPIKLYEFDNYHTLDANIYLKDKIFYVLNGKMYNDKILNFNTSNKKINKSDNNNFFIDTLLFEYNNNIYAILGYSLNIIKNNEIIYQNQNLEYK